MLISKVKRFGFFVTCVFAFSVSGCSFNVGLKRTEKLKEVALNRSEGRDKILLLSVDGLISLDARGSFFSKEPNMVAQLREKLDRARRDERIKAVLLRVNSRGGSLGATQMIFDEIEQFRKETGVYVLALFLEVAASGGLYVAMSADEVMAYPSSVTGSMGVIFVSPNFHGLGDKIGVEYRVVKTGEKKDMGSPFREWPAEERKLLEGLANSYQGQFKNAVFSSRKSHGMTQEDLSLFSDGRVLGAEQALKLHLIDAVGTIGDAISKIEQKRGLGSMKLVAYTRFPDEIHNPYSSEESHSRGPFGNTLMSPRTESALLDSLGSVLTGEHVGGAFGAPLNKGFYFLW